ncbi:hypothetical protein HLY00_4470 [Mycolicibacterium hippocampi]|uniref:Uncharacterized protein n=1 Tax=Mycolicibacterium hippocampi TaxID=659824 RepID=A0A850PXL3_9MYCO|nr:hypothetical protein [Mycolicibacterium hippocampi]
MPLHSNPTDYSSPLNGCEFIKFEDMVNNRSTAPPRESGKWFASARGFSAIRTELRVESDCN